MYTFQIGQMRQLSRLVECRAEMVWRGVLLHIVRDVYIYRPRRMHWRDAQKRRRRQIPAK